jgi:hypothetical protein
MKRVLRQNAAAAVAGAADMAVDAAVAVVDAVVMAVDAVPIAEIEAIAGTAGKTSSPQVARRLPFRKPLKLP